MTKNSLQPITPAAELLTKTASPRQSPAYRSRLLRCMRHASAIGTNRPCQLPLGLVRSRGRAANGARGAPTFSIGR